MNLKLLVMKKGITQLELAKLLGVHPTLISLQVNMHRLLPDRHLNAFCEFLQIERETLVEEMKPKQKAS